MQSGAAIGAGFGAAAGAIVGGAIGGVVDLIDRDKKPAQESEG
tara:strand:+ start:2391 stop:2519 length:129 start_codon:yes stop_codon:yes gene_type:complete